MFPVKSGDITELESKPSKNSGLTLANLTKAKLMQLDSELASFEKIRRAVFALESHNLRNGLDGCYAPTASLLADLTSVNIDLVNRWLALPYVKKEIQGYRQRLRLESASVRSLENFNSMQTNGKPKADPAYIIIW